MHSLAQTLTRIVTSSRNLQIVSFHTQDLAKMSISSNVRVNNVA